MESSPLCLAASSAGPTLREQLRLIAWLFSSGATDARHPGDPLTVLSKWGGEGEYMHDMSDVPELFGTPAEFWTHRKGV